MRTAQHKSPAGVGFGRRTATRVCLLGTAIVLGLLAMFWLKPLWVLDRLTQARLALAGMHSRNVQIEGHRIHYLVGGEGQPILLVHGLGSRASDWADLIPSLLRSGHTVYAIDLLGYGSSDRPANASYSIAEESGIVKGFLDAEHLQRVDLAGWSMGGWISMVVAADEPARISKLILMDSAGLRFKPSFDPALFTPTNLNQLGKLEDLLKPLPHALPDFLSRAVLERSKRDNWVLQRAVDSMLTGQDLLDGRLNQLTMPVLIVWGKQDRLTPVSMGDAIHAGVADSKLAVYDGCGHLAPGFCAKQIAPGLDAFLNGGQEHPALPEKSKAGLGLF